MTFIPFQTLTQPLILNPNINMNPNPNRTQQVLTSLKTKSPVLGMAVHPSGKIAIGAYKDRHLRLLHPNLNPNPNPNP